VRQKRRLFLRRYLIVFSVQPILKIKDSTATATATIPIAVVIVLFIIAIATIERRQEPVMSFRLCTLSCRR
jgi:hypothetical protein